MTLWSIFVLSLACSLFKLFLAVFFSWVAAMASAIVAWLAGFCYESNGCWCSNEILPKSIWTLYPRLISVAWPPTWRRSAWQHPNSKSPFSRVTSLIVTTSPWKLTFGKEHHLPNFHLGIPFWKGDVVTKDNVTLLKGGFLFELFFFETINLDCYRHCFLGM